MDCRLITEMGGPYAANYTLDCDDCRYNDQTKETKGHGVCANWLNSKHTTRRGIYTFCTSFITLFKKLQSSLFTSSIYTFNKF